MRARRWVFAATTALVFGTLTAAAPATAAVPAVVPAAAVRAAAPAAAPVAAAQVAAPSMVVPATFAAGTHWTSPFTCHYSVGNSVYMKIQYVNRSLQVGGPMQRLSGANVENSGSLLHSIQVKEYYYEGGVLNIKTALFDRTYAPTLQYSWATTMSVAEKSKDQKPTVDIKVIRKDGRTCSKTGYRLGT